MVHPTVERKLVPISVIMRDRELSDLWVADRLERQASHQLLQALVTAIEDQFPKPLTRGVLPAEVNLQPVDITSSIRMGEGGFLVREDVGTGDTTRVFPPSFNVRSLFITNHTADRSSLCVAIFGYLAHSGVLLAFHAGIFHDIWNAVRQAGKHVGQFWKKVVRFASIANLNHGPFRSGQWRRVIE